MRIISGGVRLAVALINLSSISKTTQWETGNIAALGPMNVLCRDICQNSEKTIFCYCKFKEPIDTSNIWHALLACMMTSRIISLA